MSRLQPIGLTEIVLTKIDIPRVLVARDPRNKQHVTAALRLMMEIGTIVSSEETAQELESLSLKLPKRVEVVPRQDGYDFLIGAHFFLEDGLMFRDNVIVTCSVCRHALQIRPHNQTNKSVLCCFCAADNMLTEYWKQKNE